MTDDATPPKALLPHPDHIATLRELGGRMRYRSMSEMLTRKTERVAVYTDYAGDDAGCGYETFAAYIADWGGRPALVDGIDKLRQEHGVPERMLDYKGRKDKKKAPLIRPGLAQFRRWPGLLVAYCLEKRAAARMRASHRAFRSELMERAASEGWKLNAQMATRLLNAASLIGLIGHLLEDDTKLIWVSDRDAIFDVEQGRHVPAMLQSMVEQTGGAKLKRIGCVTCPPPSNEPVPDWEIALSLPDLVAGALATSLPSPLHLGDRQWKVRDRQTRQIIEGIMRFSDATAIEPGTSCRRFIVATYVDEERDTVTTNVLHLNATPPTSPASP